MESQGKLFKCNTQLTNLAEWCIARNKQEAYTFMDKFWDDGAIMEDMYVKKWLKENPGKNLEDFIDFFFIEENPDMDFTHPYGGLNNEPLTKKVRQWVNEVNTVPDYLCHEKW